MGGVDHCPEALPLPVPLPVPEGSAVEREVLLALGEGEGSGVQGVVAVAYAPDEEEVPDEMRETVGNGDAHGKTDPTGGSVKAAEKEAVAVPPCKLALLAALSHADGVTEMEPSPPLELVAPLLPDATTLAVTLAAAVATPVAVKKKVPPALCVTG